jgi:g-D-glutamyl-meso-diaminopimelate peptidase
MFEPLPPDPKKNSFELGGFSRAQTNVLVGLTAMTVIVIVGLIYIVSQGMHEKYYISPTLDPSVLTPANLPTFPATWTPEPSQTPLPAGPTITPMPTNPPMATFTPYTPHPISFIANSGADILPFEQGGGMTAIGTSVAGRPLEVIRFGTGPSARMIVADIHGGNEWNTAALADELIEYVKAHPDVVPEKDTLYILRSFNPDGLARVLDVDGRVNDHGVDLNRNWDAGWQPTWDRDGCWDYRPTTGGDYPNSEPETQALANFVNNTPLDGLVSYHSAALGIFPGGLPPGDAAKKLADEIAAVTDYPYPGMDTGCIYAGGLVDWMVLHNVPAVDVELTDHVHTDFDQNIEVLKVLLYFDRN